MKYVMYFYVIIYSDENNKANSIDIIDFDEYEWKIEVNYYKTNFSNRFSFI